MHTSDDNIRLGSMDNTQEWWKINFMGLNRNGTALSWKQHGDKNEIQDTDSKECNAVQCPETGNSKLVSS